MAHQRNEDLMPRALPGEKRGAAAYVKAALFVFGQGAANGQSVEGVHHVRVFFKNFSHFTGEQGEHLHSRHGGVVPFAFGAGTAGLHGAHAGHKGTVRDEQHALFEAGAHALGHGEGQPYLAKIYAQGVACFRG